MLKEVTVEWRWEDVVHSAHCSVDKQALKGLTGVSDHYLRSNAEPTIGLEWESHGMAFSFKEDCHICYLLVGLD